ncbi:MAG TPA: hypothetical protein VHY58_06445 [Streptosporangiaceae bacterium]|nr:hypothetical protein [Streptosporangiaceae bacterium]
MTRHWLRSARLPGRAAAGLLTAFAFIGVQGPAQAAQPARSPAPGQQRLTGVHVWVSNDVNYSVTELNAATGGLTRVIKSSRYQFTCPWGITTAAGSVWVASICGGSVTAFPAG